MHENCSQKNHIYQQDGYYKGTGKCAHNVCLSCGQLSVLMRKRTLAYGNRQFYLFPAVTTSQFKILENTDGKMALVMTENSVTKDIEISSINLITLELNKSSNNPHFEANFGFP